MFKIFKMTSFLIIISILNLFHPVQVHQGFFKQAPGVENFTAVGQGKDFLLWQAGTLENWHGCNYDAEICVCDLASSLDP